MIALSANLANLFDRAPGRVTKIGIGCFGLLVVAAAVSGGGRVRMLAGAAVVVGAAMGLLFDDLREHLMLGDTGANAVGGVLGLALVLVVAPATRLVIMIVLLSLNLLSEYVSFSKIIDSIGPLRALDRVGTIAERRTRGQ